MKNSYVVQVKAKLKLRAFDEGGRWSWIKTGYRPNHVFEYNQKGSIITAYIGEITFDKDWIQPGDEEIVTVSFVPGQSIEKYLTVGTRWWIHEGKKLVGEAIILEV